MTISPPPAAPTATRGTVREALRRAAVQASRAPSVHNTQPWRFVLRGDAIEVHADWTRHVPAYDPLGRQLLMSCGCALLNIRAALAATGWAGDVEPFPDPRQGQVVARVVPRRGERPDPDLRRLDGAIEGRRTNRGAFSDEAPEPGKLSRLTAAAAVEGPRLVALSAPARTAFEDLTMQANRTHNADPAYRAELRAWTLPERGRLDGVPGGQAAISILAGRNEADLGGPACLLLCTEADDRPAWLAAGQALQRVLLQAAADGLASRPMTQVIEVPQLRRQLAEVVRPGRSPQVVVLIGQAPPAPATRRRRLVDVITEVD